jgi:hypothetical protein
MSQTFVARFVARQGRRPSSAIASGAVRIVRLLGRRRPAQEYRVVVMAAGEVRDSARLPSYKIAAWASRWADEYGECVADAYDRDTGELVQSVTVTRET